MDMPVYHLKCVVRAKSETLEDFVGPLDLILHLLSKHKIELKDLSVSLILDQYLEYLEFQKRMDLEIASEFVQMAAHLMWLKTKLLLSEADAEARAEMAALIHSLEERQRSETYRKISWAAQQLELKYQTGINYLVKAPEPLFWDNQAYSHRSQDLTRALFSLLDRMKRRTPPSVQAFYPVLRYEPYSVEHKTEEILRLVSGGRRVQLVKLFQDTRSRSELVAAFLSVLELCRIGRVQLDGEGEDSVIFRSRQQEKGA